MIYDYNANKGINNTVKRNVAAPTNPTTSTTTPNVSNAGRTPQTANTAVPTSTPSSSYVPGSALSSPAQRTTQQKIINYERPTVEQTKKAFLDAEHKYKTKQLMEIAEQNGALPYGTAQKTFPSMDTDYAAEILQLQQQPPTAENQQKIRTLTGLRNWKIEQDPEKYERYKDDAVDKSATAYTQRIIPNTADADKALASMRDNVNNQFTEQEKYYIASLMHQADKAREEYEKMRQNSIVSAAKNSLGSEEALAAQGLGRGVAKAPSSGFGETSRMMAATSLNNNLAASYRDEQKAINELERQYNEYMFKAGLEKAQQLMDIDKQGLAQENTNADRQMQADINNAQIEQGNKSIEAQFRSIENQNNQFNAQLAQDMAIHKDSLTLSYAQLDETRRSNLANEAIAREQLRIDEEYKKGSLTIQEYEAKTARLSAQASMAAANKKSSGGSFGGYSSYSSPSYTESAAWETPSPDAQVYAAVRSGSEAEVFATIAELKRTGQINEMQVRNYIDALNLNANSGWLK